ncbi:hypothetical protein B0H66DRAFT_613055 [Apodospora peruviana]|uniref:Zn(2)-C6 fungal-type domain-containing protein n=1 Tax=Apodospora peruviana TaxID=516989 RepID=A0AAE0MGP6_9PEZI|nr:hypothetical protein B0H66DRAFT_613055 [Apodospora peruviana]
MKACVRCRCQRIRCVSDENDPEGWCVPCKGVWPTLSKKVIHRLPCVRYKCTEIVLYRPYVRGGSLNAIRRREEPSMTGLDTQEWASKEIKTIDITLGICEEPVALKVCKFTPQDGKVLVRTWLEGSVDKDMPPYALADMRSTACWFREYVTRNCLQPTTLGLALQNSDPLIQETYKAAIQHYYRLQSFQVTVNSPRAIFLHNLFKLWFANRHMVGSSWICGKEILEIDPGSEVEQHPLSKRVRTPRLVVAQFDNVNILEILTPLRVDVLHQLEDMLGRNNIQDWFTVYVAVFILLHEVSVSSKDRAEDAIANSAESRYSLPHFVEELQMGANIILVHWHYYRRQANPLTITDQLDSPLSELTPEEFDFVVKSYKFMEKRWTEMKILLEQKNWEHEYYWVSQMFDTNMWAPKPGFATINKEDTTDERKTYVSEVYTAS